MVTGDNCPDKQSASRYVEDLYNYRSMLETTQEILQELTLMGLPLQELKANKNIVLELGTARNIRRACDALDLKVTPTQSLKLARHMRAGHRDYFPEGVPLSDDERRIAVALWTEHFKINLNGHPLTDEHREDCERCVRANETPRTMLQNVGEVSGCFSTLLLLGIISFLVIWVTTAVRI